MEFKGHAHVYGDNIDTDVITPARYLTTFRPEELAKICMIDLDSEFIHRVRPGDMIVAGANFGCGSSREHSPVAIKACGISCVIAVTFARIFYRNAINIGLPILECPEIREVKNGDSLMVDLTRGLIRDLSNKKEFKSSPFPPFMRELIQAGGLLAYGKARFGS